MADDLSNSPGYLQGSSDGTSSAPGYLKGRSDGTTSSPVYTHGRTTAKADKDAFLRGSLSVKSFKPAYVGGGGVVKNNKAAYTKGGQAPKASIPGYTYGTSALWRSSRIAYLAGVVRGSTIAYLEGTNLNPGEPEMAEYSYIWLKSDDLSMQYKFKVVATGYNDGELDRAENLKRTVGGGLDHSVGANYQGWNPTIRVRETESESGFGDLDNLKAFFELNNPNGTPSNNITFIDHHGIARVVHMMGGFRKSLLTAKIEGVNTLYLVALNLIEVRT